MYNWSVDEEKFKKEDPEGYKIWRLEQTINYGEPREKLNKRMVKKYWDTIQRRIDPRYRRFLEHILWGRNKKAL